MKKILLSFVLALAANSAFSQRDIDWSIEEILLPTELRSTGVTDNPSNTTTFFYKIVCKNISMQDTVLPTDTFGLRVAGYFVPASGTGKQFLFGLPSSDTFRYSIRRLNRKVNPNDTIHISGTLAAGIRPNFTSKFILSFSSFLLNRDPNNGIPAEPASTGANNSRTKSGTWFNPQGWGLNINDLTADAVSIYPNPAKNNANIQTSLTSANGASVVSVFDMNGKLIFKGNANAEGFIQLNTADMNAGIYVVNVTTGSTVLTSKLIIE
jgi:hypothetical protein